MFPDYIDAILNCYHKKKATGDLPQDMLQLSPARFRDACLQVCREKYNRKDQGLLTAFFSAENGRDACLHAINHFKISKFKPLIHILKGRTSDTLDHKNFELLAWMIDFEHRPFNPDIDYESVTSIPKVGDQRSNQKPTEESDRDAGKYSSVQIGTHFELHSVKKRKFVFIITVTVSLAAIGTWVVARKASPPPLTGQERCMYWAEDHFQPISCNKKIDNVQVIALDTEIVAHLKKITRPDTITAKAIGSVWYVRYRGDYEFYTDSGFHPIDPQLRLRPLTEFIIRHHVPAAQ